MGLPQFAACYSNIPDHVWCDYKFKQLYQPLHSTSLGSGSHCPLSMHVVVLGPVSVSPDEQLNVTVVPSVTGSLYPITVISESSTAAGRGYPQLAV